MSSILRGGRLTATRKDVVNFISSVHDDQRIAHATVLVNEAHVIAMAKARAISPSDARKILRALRELENQIPIREGVEDVHVLIEEYVTKRTGRQVGGQLHVGKSRNDQVVTAIRMTLRQEMLELSGLLLSLEGQLLQLARKHVNSIFPGYTHLQLAQPITFAHYLVANGDSILRDNERIKESYARVNLSPMGAGALAGTSFNLDRRFVAELLGFDGLVQNSLDAVGSRDFLLEFLSVCSIIALDLARMAQDIIFYSSADLALIELPDEFTSTSSIMPQKKNPDALEVVRARCAQVVGNFTSASITTHALPSGYNLDFQENTPLAWRSVDTVKACLKILIELIPKIYVNKTIEERRHLQFGASTEIANILVRKEKIPFRTAHRIVGQAVRLVLEKGALLGDLSPKDWERVVGRKLDGQTLRSIAHALDMRRHVESYRTSGSANPRQTESMIRDRAQQVQVLIAANLRAFQKLKESTRKLRVIARKV